MAPWKLLPSWISHAALADDDPVHGSALEVQFRPQPGGRVNIEDEDALCVPRLMLLQLTSPCRRMTGGKRRQKKQHERHGDQKLDQREAVMFL